MSGCSGMISMFLLEPEQYTSGIYFIAENYISQLSPSLKHVLLYRVLETRGAGT